MKDLNCWQIPCSTLETKNGWAAHSILVCKASYICWGFLMHIEPEQLEQKSKTKGGKIFTIRTTAHSKERIQLEKSRFELQFRIKPGITVSWE